MMWTGSKDQDGYGLVRAPGATYRRAHRVAYEAAHGEIPAGKVVCHRCDKPSCVVPGHLWAGSPLENAQDMWRKGRAVITRTTGERQPHAKLNSEAVKAILVDARPKKDIAADYGVHPSLISRIHSGRAWRHAQGV